MTRKADMHTHTTASDGLNRPADIVRLAKQAGLAAVAITDHDTIAGVAEAVEEGRRLGIEVVPGVEISTNMAGKEIHVLGYFIEIADERLLARLETLRETRNKRNALILERLEQLGLPLDMEEVVAGLNRPLMPDETIGRPHIAAAMVRKGYVDSIQEAFDRYLARGAKAYTEVPRVRPMEAADWILAAGGVPVLAHPGLYKDDELAEEIVSDKFVGIEAYHSEHSEADETKYAKFASERGLLVTGGSDFHGERQGQVFHGPIGARSVDIEIVERLRRAARSMA